MKKLKKKIKSYIREREIEAAPITIEGFCRFINIAEAELPHLIMDEADRIAIERLRTASKADIIEGGLEGRYNASTVKLLLANMGMQEQSDQNITISFEGRTL